MKRIIFIGALSILSSPFAGAADFKDIVEKQRVDLISGNLAGYKLIWGAPDPTIEKLITDSDRKSAKDNFLGGIIKAQSGNSFAGNGASCAASFAMNNSGGYMGPRVCATEYRNRAWIQANMYAQGYTFMASAYNIDYGYHAATGAPFLIYFTPQGYASEFQWIYNATQ